MTLTAGIYCITNTTNGKVYIGSSNSVHTRKHSHFYHLRRGTHWNRHLQRAYSLFGESSIVYKILEFCSVDALIEREGWWMHLLDSMNPKRGYNLRTADRVQFTAEHRARISESKRGNPGRRGQKLSDEHRAKLSESRMGDKNPMKRADVRAKQSASLRGRKLSDETKEKIGAAHRGRKYSEEVRDNMSVAQKKRYRKNPMSDETREKLRQLNTGRIQSDETKARKSAVHKGKPWSAARRLAEESRRATRQAALQQL